MYDEEVNHMVPVKEGGKRYECRCLCDLVELNGAEALMVYEDDFYRGYPVFTKNSWGKGTAYYVCADADQEFYNDIFQKLTIEAGIKPILNGTIPDELEITSRESDGFEFVFAQNFSSNEVKLEKSMLEDLLQGTMLMGDITDSGGIHGYGTVVIRRKLTSAMDDGQKKTIS